MAKKGVYTRLVLAQNGGREDDTKDYDRVSDDEYVSEDEAVKGEPWMKNGRGTNDAAVVVKASSSQKLSKTGNHFFSIEYWWIQMN